MKKLILALSLLLSATTSLLKASQHQHTPAKGTIQLGDEVNKQGIVTKQGIIVDIILNDINFQEERDTITNFSQNVQNPTYQGVVTLIKNTNGCLEGGLEVLEAFERAIMHYIHQKNYITYIENKYLNIFITGIRWNWVTPSEWARSWHKENSYMVHQCMKELSALAQIAKKYSNASSLRMKATVESYIHWRKNTLTTIGTYLLANGLLRRDLQKSPLSMLINGGLKNTPNALVQVKNDIVDFTTTISGYVMPLGNRIFNGRNSSKETISQPIVSPTITTTPKNSPSEKNSSPSTYSQLKKSIQSYNQILKEKFLPEKQETIQEPKKLVYPESSNLMSENNPKSNAKQQEYLRLLSNLEVERRKEKEQMNNLFL